MKYSCCSHEKSTKLEMDGGGVSKHRFRQPWECFISTLGELCSTINQMCEPVIIAAAFMDPGIFCCKPSLIGWRSRSPCAFWKTSEQKVECQFNWCVCGSSCTLQISSGVQVKDKGLDTVMCARSRDELPCEHSLKCWVLLLQERAAPLAACWSTSSDSSVPVFAF